MQAELQVHIAFHLTGRKPQGEFATLASSHLHPAILAGYRDLTSLRYDFPLEAHIWTFEGAVCARYIQDEISPRLADEFRSDVFASQRMISNKDDLYQFTSTWLQKHGKKMPAKLDPTGKLAKEVNADLALGKRLNVEWTPTVVVVTRDQYQVVCGTKDGANDASQLLQVVKAAVAQAH